MDDTPYMTKEDRIRLKFDQVLTDRMNKAKKALARDRDDILDELERIFGDTAMFQNRSRLSIIITNALEAATRRGRYIWQQ